MNIFLTNASIFSNIKSALPLVIGTLWLSRFVAYLSKSFGEAFSTASGSRGYLPLPGSTLNNLIIILK